MIEVRLGRDVGGAERIEPVAARLGVQVDWGSSDAPVTTIDGIAVAPDAPEWAIEALTLRALRPRHILFLCVANSARSQLAEGIARHLAQGTVEISSAGSAPTSVRPQAVTVMGEIGLDISGQTSMGLDDVHGTVDAVITLCAEEVCPVWLHSAWRLHWGLPDPAAVEGSENEQLEAFRTVREELLMRLGVLLGDQPGR